MASIDISAQIIGDKELSAALARLSSHDIPKAIKAGVRDAARAGRTTLAKAIGQRYSLSAARIKQDVPTARISNGGQTAVITTSRKPITAMQFKARQTGRGLSMAIFRGERTVVKSGFIAQGLPFKRKGRERMPIEVIHGPSIHAIYTGGKHSQAITQATEQRIVEQLEKGILRALGAMGRGYGRA
jgi:uncharacterized protein YgbK (DUF1537 family)